MNITEEQALITAACKHYEEVLLSTDIQDKAVLSSAMENFKKVFPYVKASFSRFSYEGETFFLSALQMQTVQEKLKLNKIRAIKEFRTYTNAGLRAAKTIIEDHFEV